LDLRSTSWITNDYNNISVFSNVTINTDLLIRRSSTPYPDPTLDPSAEQQYFVNPAPL
jgi:hypothetical protein